MPDSLKMFLNFSFVLIILSTPFRRKYSSLDFPLKFVSLYRPYIYSITYIQYSSNPYYCINKTLYSLIFDLNRLTREKKRLFHRKYSSVYYFMTTSLLISFASTSRYFKFKISHQWMTQEQY